MKVSGKVISVEVKDGGMFAVIQCNRKLPKVGEYVDILWDKKLSGQQLKFWWVFMTWLVEEAGMKDQGYATPEELHYTLTGHFLAVKTLAPGGVVVVRVRSITELDGNEMSELIEKAKDFFMEFFEIDTTPFFIQYANEYASFNQR